VSARQEKLRVLITGLSTDWGGWLARALEAAPEVEAIIGVDSSEPRVELERTEFVKTSNRHSLLARIIRAAEIDTVVDTRLSVNSLATSPREAHENNVAGTMNILAACAEGDSPVRKFIFKSSGHYYGTHQDDPAFFSEEMGRRHPPRTQLERDVVEAEGVVDEFARTRPKTTVTVLRCASVLGPDVDTVFARMFSLPLVPMILGFDPRLQFVHQEDVVRAIEFVTLRDVPGTYNVAADGVLALSEAISLLGKRPAPVLPPFGFGTLASVARAFGLPVSEELPELLRFGRGLDNRRLKAAGFTYAHTSREAVLRLGEHLRLHPVRRGLEERYTYEREVEEFLRWSPYVRRAQAEAAGGERAS
jgi:UDP-glucose 4-epimerase